jgi:hypothetical protein
MKFRKFRYLMIRFVSEYRKNVNKSIIKTNFVLQIDESTDINGKAQLIGFIRCIHDNKINKSIFVL